MSPGRPKAQRTGVTTAANEDIVTMVRRSQVPPVPKVHPGTQTSKEKPEELSEESSNSSEDSQTDEEMDEEAMSSSTWIMKKAKHCQKCKKEYPTAGEASTCLVAHKLLRCYFCFRVCKNVEMLHQHYSRAHRRGGPDGFVDCPCCKGSIPFKSVSCHVISKHLTEEESSSNEDSQTDSEMDEEAMSSPTWYINKAKHCQKCKTEYPTAGEASTCLVSHNRLRCYFCFRVCKNVRKLFQHFDRAHRRGGRNGFVDCPCCKQSIPFKAVSCHVISMHLSERDTSRPKNYRVAAKPRRYPN